MLSLSIQIEPGTLMKHECVLGHFLPALAKGQSFYLASHALSCATHRPTPRTPIRVQHVVQVLDLANTPYVTNYTAFREQNRPITMLFGNNRRPESNSIYRRFPP